MATAQFTLEVPSGFRLIESDLPSGIVQMVAPSGLTWDGTEWSGVDGTYDVYSADNTSTWSHEEVVLTSATAPTLDSAVPDQSFTEGDTVNLDLSAYFAGTVASYSITGLPASTGLSFNTSTGMLSGTANSNDTAASPFNLTVTASNTEGSANDTFAVSISEPVAESATATFTLEPPAGFTYVTIASGFDDYITQSWVTAVPKVGGQIIYATASNTTIDNQLDLQTDSEGTIEAYYIDPDDSMCYYVPFDMSQLATADDPVAQVPQGTITPSVSNITHNEATVSFTYDAADADSFEHSTDGTNWMTVTSPFTRTGLNAETLYDDGQLRAVNTTGNGTAVSYSFTTEAEPVAVPTSAPVLSQSGSTVTGSSLVIAGSYDGDDATGYEYTIDGGTTWTAFTSFPFTVSGRDYETQYTVTTRATNASGAGSESNSVTLTTLAELEVLTPAYKRRQMKVLDEFSNHTQAVSERLDYDILKGDWLAGLQDEYLSAEIIQGVEIVEACYPTDDRVKVWVSGVTEPVTIKVLIKTIAGRWKQCNINIKVRD